MKSALLGTALSLILGAGCASKPPASEPEAAAEKSDRVTIDPSSSPISAAAEREIIRRQEAMRRADEAFLRGQRQMADGNYEAAMESSRQALSQ